MEKSTPEFPDWAALQQNYLDALAAFGKAAAGGDVINPWVSALDFWWRSVTPALTGSNQALLAHIVNQTRTLFDLAGEFGKLLVAMSTLPGNGEDWQSVMDRQFEAMKASLGEGTARGGRSPLQAFWELPLDNWERVFSSISALPGDMLKNFKAQDLECMPDRFPSLPGIGYTREMQEQYQEAFRLWADCQRNLSEYQAALTRVGIQALERMRRQLLAGHKVQSLRDLYNLWVECNEAEYAEYVFTPEYSESYGRMVNSLMRFKRHSQMLMDEVLAALNMPSQREITTLQKRQMEMRRELRASLAKQAADAQALEALRREVEALRRGREQGGSQSGGARRGGTRRRKQT
jgi:class III poly(R)-hydroxyalkanoic acid synthase PhaE subunit